MAKKINQDAIIIKGLLKKGMKKSQIVELCGYKWQKVSYWSKKEIKETKRKKNWKAFILIL